MNTIEKKIDAKLILSIVAAGIMSFSGVVVETAMNVTFPTLMKEFNIDTATVQWITTGYLLVLACIIPASSYLKKRFTTKSLFVTAICLFIIGTVMAAAAPVFSLLLAGRLIQGIGTGIALPLMFNIVLEQVPEERLGLMMGIASLITAMAPAVGPSLGGLIVNNFGWRMIFIALLPGCLAGAVLSPVSGRFLDRFGAQRPILFGNVCIIGALFCFSVFSGSLAAVPAIIFYLFFALGQGFSVGNSMTNGLSHLAPEKNPDGNAVINTLQQLAGAVGTSVVSTIVASAQAASSDMAAATREGSSYAFYLLAGLSVVMILCSVGAFVSARQIHRENSGCAQTQ